MKSSTVPASLIRVSSKLRLYGGRRDTPKIFGVSRFKIRAGVSFK